jgi:hypothetical protein
MKNISKSIFKNLLIDFKKLQFCMGRIDVKDEASTLAKEKRTSEGFKIESLALEWMGIDPVDVGSDSISESIKLTDKALENNSAHIWQASISSNGKFCAVDLLTKSKNKEGAYDIIEIKSCGTPKSNEIVDAAFQVITLEDKGIEIDRVIIVSVDVGYVRHGEIEPKKLFRLTSLQDKHGNSELSAKEAAEFQKSKPLTEKAIDKVLENLENNKKDLNKGSQCLKCSGFNKCFGEELPEYNVGQIYKTGKKADVLIEAGDLNLEKIEISSEMTDKQKVYYQAVKKDIEIFDKSKVESFISNLTYPIIYFDYETISSAIPMFDKSRPFQQVPTQYTLQVEHEDGTYEKYNYIFRGEGDPRQELMSSLKKDLPKTGSILVWFDRFEKGVNNELAEFFGGRDFFNDMNDRIIDLMLVFQKLHFYKKEFKASASIKKIIAGLFPEDSYKELDVQEGETASILYEKALFREIDGKEREELLGQLVTYCEADGFNMKKIKDFLMDKCGMEVKELKV